MIVDYHYYTRLSAPCQRKTDERALIPIVGFMNMNVRYRFLAMFVSGGLFLLALFCASVMLLPICSAYVNLQ